MKPIKPVILRMLPFVATAAVLVIQTLAMSVLSKQYREIGYIEYGWFNRPEGRLAQSCIVWAPLVGSLAFFLTYAKWARRAATESGDDERPSFVWILSSLLFLVIAIRTLLLSVQGYALIFI